MASLRHSIVRRSSGVTVAFLLGHALNYVLMLGANRILGSGFGLFYTAVLGITVLMAPISALMLALTRFMAEVASRSGAPAVASLTTRLLTDLATRGAIAAAVIGVLFVPAGLLLRIEAWQILLLMPATVVALIAAESIRIAFQSLLLFRWASAVWVASQGAQFAFAIIGLLIGDGVWPGIFGIFLGAALVAALFSVWFRTRAGSETTVPAWPASLTRGQWPLVAGYSLFVALNNADMVVAYLLLPRAALDVYAASALLPKAIITATTPISQVTLPVIIERIAAQKPIRSSVGKAVLLVSLASAVAAACLWVAIPYIQGTVFAIRGLDVGLTRILSGAAVALSILRVLLIVEIAVSRCVLGLAQLAAIVLFVALLAGGADAGTIAVDYATISCAFVLLAGTAQFGFFGMKYSQRSR